MRWQFCKVDITLKRMKPLTIEDMIPKQSSFTLRASGIHEWVLRPINAEDRMWLINTFGGQAGLNAVFEAPDWTGICRIAYRQLEQESKKALVAAKVVEIDEEGNEAEVLITGPRLLQRMVISFDDQEKILKAVLETIGLSEKVMLMLAEDQDKKKETSAPSQRRRAGVKSSTRSRVSTVGRTKKSGKRRSRKSTSR